MTHVFESDQKLVVDSLVAIMNTIHNFVKQRVIHTGEPFQRKTSNLILHRRFILCFVFSHNNGINAEFDYKKGDYNNVSKTREASLPHP